MEKFSIFQLSQKTIKTKVYIIEEIKILFLKTEKP